MSRPSSYYSADPYAPEESASYVIPVSNGRPPASPSTQQYRHSGLIESGDYRHVQAASPATSYASAQSHQGGLREQDAGGGAGAQQRQSRLFSRMPSMGQLNGAGASSSSGTTSTTGGLGRSVSISGLGGGGSGATTGAGGRRTSSSQQRMSYSPNQQALHSPTWSNSAGLDPHPPPPQSSAHVQQQYRVSPSGVLPPQTGAMRRGTSYEGAGAYQQQPPPPISTSLLPTSSASSRGYTSPMSGVLSTSIDYAPSPHLSSNSPSSSHLFPHLANSGPSSVLDNPDRHTSYSPSHYAAAMQQAPLPPPSVLSSSSHYITPTTSAASFYAHHIPTASSSTPSAQPLSTTYPPPLHTPAHQPQAQQYYQSQQYFDSTLPGGKATTSAAAAYYAGGQEMRSVSVPEQGGGGSKGFRRVRDVREIKRVVNAQPAGRRADPAGGFISPLKALTMHLPQTYHIVNPAFRYETSLNPRRVLTKPSKPATNDGFDNEDSDYILYVNDVLGPEEKDRYLILDVLGQGTFGQVVKCQNLKTHEIVAVKVVKNKPAYFQQSMMEVTILELINNQWDKDDEHHMLRLKDTFIHHSHLCLVFELLSNNLYELIKQNSFRGLSTSLVRVFTAQLLDALTVLQEAKIIHCDLKPENILLKSLQSPTIKVIDFGSACHEKQTVYTYIQSRFYRSPEVILCLPYSTAIDMWSLGCICVELFLGLPLFPGTSEYNQLTRIIEMLGMPPDHMLENGKQTKHFFEVVTDDYGRRRWRLKTLERYSQEHKLQEQPSKKYFNATTLPEIIKQYPIARKGLKEADVDKEMKNRLAFIDFVQGLLHLDPERRWSPQQAKLHPFVLGEPLLAPFVPPPHLKIGGFSSKVPLPASPQPDPKRPYGGLPPAPQRSTTRTYQDAKAYNQHLTQQQGYTAQAQQAAQRAAQVPTNPYHVPDVSPQGQQQAYAAPRMQAPGSAQQQQQQMHLAQQQQLQNQQQLQSQQQQQQHQQAYNASFNYSQQQQRSSQPPMAAAPAVANPPAVHHYTTRGRSNTITQDLPPALQKLGQGLHTGQSGQSITPVLRREDQWEAWERIQSGGDQGMSRRVSISRNPHLSLLQEQAENGLNSWQSPLRVKAGGQSAYPAYYQNPGQQQQQQPQFSVVVDGRDRQPDLFDAGITAPPQAYSSANPARHAPPYSSSSSQATPQQQQQGGSYDIPFDSYDHRDGLGTLYQPMQPFQQSTPQRGTAGSNHQQAQPPPPSHLQPSFYSPSVPLTSFPPPANSKMDVWP